MDFAPQLFSPDVTTVVSTIRREHESSAECLGVFGGSVCLLMQRQGGEGVGNCLIHMHGDKKWWD